MTSVAEIQKYALISSVADLVPGSGAFLTPGTGMDKKNQDPDPGSVSGMNIPDHISESLETIFGLRILKFFADPGSGIFLTLDPEWKIRIRDPG